MKGERVSDEPGEDGIYPMLLPGQYGKRGGTWFGRTPGNHLANLARHQIEEHADGTITVQPSILVSTLDKDGNRVELWHGWLRAGEWVT